MQTVKETAVLTGEASKGNEKKWKARVLQDGGEFFTQVEFWQVSPKGESLHQTSTPKLVRPTNVGQANERGGREQAIAEMEALAAKMRQKHYLADGETPSPRAHAMLLHDARKGGYLKKMTWPAMTSAKLDGIRCLADGVNGFWTRNGLSFPDGVTDHLHDALARSTAADSGLTKAGWRWVRDGELMLPATVTVDEHMADRIHADAMEDYAETLRAWKKNPVGPQPVAPVWTLTPVFTFQDTVRACKKARTTSELLVFHVFDAYLPEMPNLGFEKRYAAARQIVEAADSEFVQIVCADMLAGQDGLQARHDDYASQGYEGLVLRSLDGEYTPGHRSGTALKFKMFQDAEFLVVGVVAATGNHEGAAVFVCKGPAGEFTVNPDGGLDVRRAIYAERKKYLGRWVKVTFQNLTDDGMPRFPTRAVVREEVEG